MPIVRVENLPHHEVSGSHGQNKLQDLRRDLKESVADIKELGVRPDNVTPILHVNPIFDPAGGPDDIIITFVGTFRKPGRDKALFDRMSQVAANTVRKHFPCESSRIKTAEALTEPFDQEESGYATA